MHMGVQFVVRVPDAIAASVDALVAEGVCESRSEAVRAGLEALIDAERRAAIGRAIVAGYERVPQRDEEFGWPDAARTMIAEEPW
jgi:Arc/MetJ-type ribon-helix-helix transcriptional regulator